MRRDPPNSSGTLQNSAAPQAPLDQPLASAPLTKAAKPQQAELKNSLPSASTVPQQPQPAPLADTSMQQEGAALSGGGLPKPGNSSLLAGATIQAAKAVRAVKALPQLIRAAESSAAVNMNRNVEPAQPQVSQRGHKIQTEDSATEVCMPQRNLLSGATKPVKEVLYTESIPLNSAQAVLQAQGQSSDDFVAHSVPAESYEAQNEGVLAAMHQSRPALVERDSMLQQAPDGSASPQGQKRKAAEMVTEPQSQSGPLSVPDAAGMEADIESVGPEEEAVSAGAMTNSIDTAQVESLLES